MEIVIIILIAFLLDCILGDPAHLPHPIRLIGFFISKGEKLLRSIFPKSKGGEIAAGAVLAVCVPLLSFGLCYLVLYVAGQIHIYAKYGVETLLCYQIFAAKSLKDESMRVYRHIEAGDLEGSRKYLSYIVGRDTKDLDFSQITRAVVETVAENASDGVIAPMLFMAMGGAPLGMLYKAVNTLDSMVGYKNDKYINFGKVSAISDDVWNYIPARLTAVAMGICAFFTGFDGKNAFRIFKRDRYNHASPNSAQPESICAGALHVQLAGDAYYFGKLYKKKTIGDDDRAIEAADIKNTVKLMYGASVFSLILLLGIRICLELL